MKRNSIRAIMGFVALVSSLAASLAFAAPEGQAARINLYDQYGTAVAYAQTGYRCLGNGTVELSASAATTGARPGTPEPYVYFQTRVHRLTNSGWVDVGVVWGQNWIWGNIGGPYYLNFGVGYGKVRFMTTFANWNSTTRRYEYVGPSQELFLWSNGQVFGDSPTCTL